MAKLKGYKLDGWVDVKDCPIPLDLDVVAVDNSEYTAIGNMTKDGFILHKPLATFNEHKIVAWMFSIGVPKTHG